MTGCFGTEFHWEFIETNFKKLLARLAERDGFVSPMAQAKDPKLKINCRTNVETAGAAREIGATGSGAAQIGPSRTKNERLKYDQRCPAKG